MKCVLFMELEESPLWEYGTKSPGELGRGLSCFQSLLRTCAVVSGAPQIDYTIRKMW